VPEPTPHPPPKDDFWHLFRSMRHSLAGFAEAFRHERSFREDLVLAAILTPLAVILPVNAVSTAVMLTSLSLIIIAELLNSAIEKAIDDISLETRPLAKRAKDMASAGVFLAFLNCLVVWSIIIIANWHRIKTLEFLRWPPQILP
jgi:diacylglycerol kinase (ATP)